MMLFLHNLVWCYYFMENEFSPTQRDLLVDVHIHISTYDLKFTVRGTFIFY